MATETAKLIIDGKELILPVITGTEGEKAIDIPRGNQREKIKDVLGDKIEKLTGKEFLC